MQATIVLIFSDTLFEIYYLKPENQLVSNSRLEKNEWTCDSIVTYSGYKLGSRSGEEGEEGEKRRRKSSSHTLVPWTKHCAAHDKVLRDSTKGCTSPKETIKLICEMRQQYNELKNLIMLRPGYITTLLTTDNLTTKPTSVMNSAVIATRPYRVRWSNRSCRAWLFGSNSKWYRM